MKRIFFIKWHEESYSGADTFLAQLTSIITERIDYEFNVIVLSSPVKGYVPEKIGSVMFHHVSADASGAFRMLHDKSIITNSPDNIFIQNFCPASLPIRKIKQIFPLSRCIYIIHDLMWLSWVMGDVDAYIDIITERDIRGYSEKEIQFFKALFHDCKNACMLSDAVVVLNPDTFELLVSIFKIDKGKIWLIRNGIDDTRLSNNKPHFKDKGPGQARKLLFCGRFTIQKGFYTLLIAMERILEKRDDVELICCGGKPEDIDKSIITELKSKDKIRWEGVVNRQKVRQLMDDCDCVIFPSLYEQSGYVAIEAKMAGVPLIVSNGFGLCDLAEDNCAIMFESGNPISLEGKILEVLNMDKKDLNLLAKRSRTDYMKRYNPDTMKNKYTGLFDEL